MVIFIRNRQELEHQIILLREEGWSIRALSKHFTMGRNTVRRILRKNRKQREQGHDALDQRRPMLRKSKLDAFKPMIQQLLQKYPQITGVRMCEELAADGFDGGHTIVMDYLRKIRPRPKKEPELRFETPPGYQGQMDWSPYTLNFTRSGRQKVVCFSYILGFSRRQYIDFTMDRKFYTLIRRHQDAAEVVAVALLGDLVDQLGTGLGGEPRRPQSTAQHRGANDRIHVHSPFR